MFPRYIKNPIHEALQDTPVIYIMGPRQAGKTTLVKDIINQQWNYISFDDISQLNIARSDPVGFIRNLPQGRPTALDEVQRIPEIFVSIKQAVDENRGPCRFLLTGSANALLLPQLSDSLAGRMETIRLNALSEYEILGTTPTFLPALWQGEIPQTQDIRIRDHLIQRIVTGCFPEPIQRNKEKRIQAWYTHYLQSLIQKDLRDLEQIKHHQDINLLLEILSLYSSQLININELSGKVELSRLTIKKYLALLQQLFLVDTLPAWHKNAYKRLIKTPKIHITDTGIVCAARGINAEKIKANPDLYGPLLETFIFNELKKQSYFIDEKIDFFHYRDKDKVEVDLVIQNSLGEIIGIEIKATASIRSSDFRGLKKLKALSNQFKMGILLYDGDHITAFGDNLFAAPIAASWS